MNREKPRVERPTVIGAIVLIAFALLFAAMMMTCIEKTTDYQPPTAMSVFRRQ